jgi:hypothetical protein
MAFDPDYGQTLLSDEDHVGLTNEVRELLILATRFSRLIFTTWNSSSRRRLPMNSLRRFLKAHSRSTIY